MPKIQGDAVELHPAIVMAAIIIGGSLAGLLGAILALPVTAAGRDVVRYLFRRMSPDDPEALAAIVARLGPLPPGRTDPDRRRGRDRADRWLTRATRTRSSRWTRRPRTRSSRPPTAGWPGNTTRTSRPAPRRRPGWRRSMPPGPGSATRWRERPSTASGRSGSRTRAEVARQRRPARVPAASHRAAPAGARDAPTAPPPRPPEEVSRDWTSGRSNQGGGYDASMRVGRRPRARPAHHPATRPGACSTSAATPAGRWARSPAATSSTSSGWTGRRSAGRIATRWTRSCAGPGGGKSVEAEAADRRGLFRRR